MEPRGNDRQPVNELHIEAVMVALELNEITTCSQFLQASHDSHFVKIENGDGRAIISLLGERFDFEKRPEDFVNTDERDAL